MKPPGGNLARSGLRRGESRLARTGFRPGTGYSSFAPRSPWGTDPVLSAEAKSKIAATGRAPIRPVSQKRARENRERAAMADRRWPDRREGTVMCAVPGCNRPATDLHEILPRGRSGSITDEANTAPTCRPHNEELTKSPAWGYRAGLLKHDGVCCRGRDVCERYSESGDIA